MITLLILILLIIVIFKLTSLARKREPRKNIEVSPEDRKKMRKFKFIVLLLWLPVVLLMLDILQWDRWVNCIYLTTNASLPYNLENWVNRLKHYIPGLHIYGGVILENDTPETLKARESIVTHDESRQQLRSFFRWYDEEDPCAGIIGGIRKTDFIIVGIISIIVLGPIFKFANRFQKYLIEKRAIEKLKEAAKLKDYNGKPIAEKEIGVGIKGRKKMRKFRFIVLLLWLPVVLLMLDFMQYSRWVDRMQKHVARSGFRVPCSLEGWRNGLKRYIPGLHTRGLSFYEGANLIEGDEEIVTPRDAGQHWRRFFSWYDEKDSKVRIRRGGIKKTDFIIVGIISIIVLGSIFKVANGFQKRLIKKKAMGKLKESAKLKDPNGKPIEGREHRLIKEGLEWAKAPEQIITFAEDIIGDVIISGKTKEDASAKKIYPKKDIGLCLSGIKKEVYGDLVQIMVKYEKEGDIPKNELDTVSTEHMSLTNLILKSWASVDEATREIEIRKYASGVAMAQLSNRAFTLVDKLITLYSNTDKTDLEKGLIKEKVEEVKSRIAVLRELRGDGVRTGTGA